jgi:glycosyltransferase involved in cell wall biosynthesis
MSAPAVSIVIAAYNSAATLEETLASVAAQTFTDFELIVIDDGSSDATPALLQTHAAQWPWLSWVRQPNAGASAARQKGIALARSDLIAFLDADDLWHPSKLAKQVPLMLARPELVLSYTDMLDFFPDHDASRSLLQQKSPARGQVLPALFQANFIYTPTVIVRKAALERVGGFDLRLKVNEDFDLWLRLAELGEFDYLGEVLGRRRVLPGSLTRANQRLCYEQDLHIIDTWVAKRPDLFPLNSPQVRQRLALIHSRIGEHCLGQRDFLGARRAYRMALQLGTRSAPTLARSLAAHLPPLMYSFWWLKARLRPSTPT